VFLSISWLLRMLLSASRPIQPKRVTYGELIGGKRFSVALTGNNINATTGRAPMKAVQDLKIVGQSPQRYDIPPKVDGSLKWAVDVKLPAWCTRATCDLRSPARSLSASMNRLFEECRASSKLSAKATTSLWFVSEKSRRFAPRRH
jgi:hypothetical protein